jgi:hypothetical protein
MLGMPTRTGSSLHVQQMVVSLNALGPGAQVVQLVSEGASSDCGAVTRREAPLTEVVQGHQIPPLSGWHQAKLWACNQRVGGFGAC